MSLHPADSVTQVEEGHICTPPCDSTPQAMAIVSEDYHPDYRDKIACTPQSNDDLFSSSLVQDQSETIPGNDVQIASSKCRKRASSASSDCPSEAQSSKRMKPNVTVKQTKELETRVEWLGEGSRSFIECNSPSIQMETDQSETSVHQAFYTDSTPGSVGDGNRANEQSGRNDKLYLCVLPTDPEFFDPIYLGI